LKTLAKIDEIFPGPGGEALVATTDVFGRAHTEGILTAQID